MLKRILIGILLLAGVGGFFAYRMYTLVMSPNVPDRLENDITYIPTSSSFSDVVGILYSNGQIIDTASFHQVAEMMSYGDGVIKPGRYRISPSWSNRSLIGHLRSGRQEPVNVIFTHGWLLEDVAGQASRTIEPDSADLMRLFQNEEYVKAAGYTNETLMSLFIPNTYEFFWNASEEDFFQRMIVEHERFWDSNNRRGKADKLGMTPMEVYTLASIVEREISKDAEKKECSKDGAKEGETKKECTGHSH